MLAKVKNRKDINSQDSIFENRSMPRDEKKTTQNTLARTPPPRLLIDKNMQISWFNGAAQTIFGARQKMDISPLIADPHSRRKLSLLATHNANTHEEKKLHLIKLRNQSATQNILMVVQLMTQNPTEPTICIYQLEMEWPIGMDDILSHDFALSNAEIAISQFIAAGLGPEEIAVSRECRLSTVRTQIKKIMSKMECKTRPELTQLIHLLMRIAENNAR